MTQDFLDMLLAGDKADTDCETTPDRADTASATHLIRAVMAYGFKRARLRYAYMILRGKDLDTGKYSPELREQKFKDLEYYLEQVVL